jgi:hypothetical protein
MKRYLLLFFLIVCQLILCESVYADKQEKVDTILTQFKLEEIEDGKRTDTSYIVQLSIFDYYGKPIVNWDFVSILPLHDMKKIVLGPNHRSTTNDTIRDAVVRPDHFSFKLMLTPERMMQVVGTKKGKGTEYTVEGVGIWWSEILKRKTKTEWQSTNKTIILPYKEIY